MNLNELLYDLSVEIADLASDAEDYAAHICKKEPDSEYHLEYTLKLVELVAALMLEECAKICDRVEDELRDDDQVSAAGGAWRCGFEIRERKTNE